MKRQGTAPELGGRRRLVVQRVLEGWKQRDIAAFLGVHTRTVCRWVTAYGRGGDDAIKASLPPWSPSCGACCGICGVR